MTREEAIKELSYIADGMPSMECRDWKEAIDIAIKALKQQPKTEPNRCNQCKYYEGVHNVQGHAPCSLLKAAVCCGIGIVQTMNRQGQKVSRRKARNQMQKIYVIPAKLKGVYSSLG